MDTPRNNSSQILPLVVAAFAGATLAIACERPDARAQIDQDAPTQRVAAPPAQRAVEPEPPVAAATPAAAAPVAGARPAPETAVSDTVITGRIKAALLTDPALSGADISVNTDRGVVSLLGSVKSHEQTGIASAHAQRQEGVMRVDSHLTIAEP